jgi:uridylate kinase
VARGPIDPEKLVGLVGRLAILERLLAGAMVSIDLVGAFFGSEQPAPRAVDAESATEMSWEEFIAILRRVVDVTAERIAKRIGAEPVSAA